MSADLVTVTRDFIDAGGTPTGKPGCYAWTNAQHRILGTFPPRRGWIEKAIGRQITPEAADAFLTIARRKKGISKKEKRTRNVALRSVAWTMQEPATNATPIRPAGDASPWLCGDDIACPLCHGDELGRLSCLLCDRANKS